MADLWQIRASLFSYKSLYDPRFCSMLKGQMT